MENAWTFLQIKVCSIAVSTFLLLFFHPRCGHTFSSFLQPILQLCSNGFEERQARVLRQPLTATALYTHLRVSALYTHLRVCTELSPEFTQMQCIAVQLTLLQSMCSALSFFHLTADVMMVRTELIEAKIDDWGATKLQQARYYRTKCYDVSTQEFCKATYWFWADKVY